MKRRSFLAALFAAPSVAAVAVASTEPVSVASAVEPVAFDGKLTLSVADTDGTFRSDSGCVVIKETSIFVRS